MDTHLQNRRCYNHDHKEEGAGRAAKGEETAHVTALRHMPSLKKCEEGGQS